MHGVRSAGRQVAAQRADKAACNATCGEQSCFPRLPEAPMSDPEISACPSMAALDILDGLATRDTYIGPFAEVTG